MHREILNFLKMNDVEYKEDYCLAEISTIKIGPNAFVITYPNSIHKLILLLNFLIDHKIRYKILGRMSNVLITDDFYDNLKNPFMMAVNGEHIVYIEVSEC